jgi:hypothetical protein
MLARFTAVALINSGGWAMSDDIILVHKWTTVFANSQIGPVAVFDFSFSNQQKIRLAMHAAEVARFCEALSRAAASAGSKMN